MRAELDEAAQVARAISETVRNVETAAHPGGTRSYDNNVVLLLIVRDA